MQISQSVSEPRLYIGIDVHKRSWSVSMRTDVAEHKTISFVPSSEKLYDYVRTHFPDYEVNLVYEACCCGFSHARDFLNYAWNVKVVNPADIPTSDKQAYQKTDKNDSKNLCKQLEKNNLHGIYIPTETQEQFRSLLRQRVETAKQLRRIKSQIKSMLLFHGIELPEKYDNSHWTKEFLNWLSELKWSNPMGKSSMAAKLRTYNFVYSEYLGLANELRAYARTHHKEDYYLLKSIPGIGGYLSAALLAEIGDIRRFDNEAQFSSYLGLVPGMRDSGETEKTTGITPRANGLLRAYLIEAAWVAVRKDPEIQAYYRKHIGKNQKAVVVKIAHKMARRILSVIKNKKLYEINVNLNLDSKIEIPIEIEDLEIAE